MICEICEKAIEANQISFDARWGVVCCECQGYIYADMIRSVIYWHKYEACEIGAELGNATVN